MTPDSKRYLEQIESEIEATILTEEEIAAAIQFAKTVKWQRLRNENIDFKAQNEGLNISGK